MIIFRRLRLKARHFAADRRANVVIMFAFLLIPILFAAGMGVDYAMAARARSKLDAAADAAALAAVTPAMMQISPSSTQQAAMQQAATNMFTALASQVSGLQNMPTPTITITPSGLIRTVKVSYSAKSLTTFSGVIGQTSLAIGGHSTASASTQPYINFYLLLDDSPSMAIAATTSGINTMVANTSQQGGCAFACHESNPAADNLGNPHGEDNYQLARNLGVTLRIDLLRTAVQNLTTQAQTTEGQNTLYQMGLYTFDNTFNNIQPLTSNLTMAQTAANNIQLLQVYSNNYWSKNVNNSDTDTNFSTAMNSINADMYTPGNGSSSSSPQEFLFIVTDGVEDAMVNGQRVQSLMDTSWCTTVKNRGIQIAVLYTEYLPLPTNSWYNIYIAPFQSQIAGNMQSCASPGLYTLVTTNGNISAALTNLFNLAVAQASHLTN